MNPTAVIPGFDPANFLPSSCLGPWVILDPDSKTLYVWNQETGTWAECALGGDEDTDTFVTFSVTPNGDGSVTVVLTPADGGPPTTFTTIPDTVKCQVFEGEGSPVDNPPPDHDGVGPGQYNDTETGQNWYFNVTLGGWELEPDKTKCQVWTGTDDGNDPAGHPQSDPNFDPNGPNTHYQLVDHDDDPATPDVACVLSWDVATQTFAEMKPPECCPKWTFGPGIKAEDLGNENFKLSVDVTEFCGTDKVDPATDKFVTDKALAKTDRGLIALFEPKAPNSCDPAAPKCPDAPALILDPKNNDIHLWDGSAFTGKNLSAKAERVASWLGSIVLQEDDIAAIGNTWTQTRCNRIDLENDDCQTLCYIAMIRNDVTVKKEDGTEVQIRYNLNASSPNNTVSWDGSFNMQYPDVDQKGVRATWSYSPVYSWSFGTVAPGSTEVFERCEEIRFPSYAAGNNEVTLWGFPMFLKTWRTEP